LLPAGTAYASMPQSSAPGKQRPGWLRLRHNRKEIHDETLDCCHRRLCCASGLLHAQVDDPAANFGIIPTRSEWSGVYSAAQAERGEQAYLLDECGSCHDEAGGASGVAVLVGTNFLEDWDGQSALDLARHIHSSTMGNPGDIGIAEATDLIAFILREMRFRQEAGTCRRTGTRSQQSV
jgi:hypothetical protein